MKQVLLKPQTRYVKQVDYIKITKIKKKMGQALENCYECV